MLSGPISCRAHRILDVNRDSLSFSLGLALPLDIHAVRTLVGLYVNKSAPLVADRVKFCPGGTAMGCSSHVNLV